MATQHIITKASIGAGNVFGRGVIIGDGVVIGDDNVFEDNAWITGKTIIGSGNYFGAYVAIGGPPTNSAGRIELQRPTAFSELKGQITIGDRNVIREFNNIDMPTGKITSIGNECYLMQHCTIAHDVVIEDRVILSNHCSPGGHARILAGANLGKGVQTHQRTVIGQCAMIGVGAVIIRNVVPGATVAGNPARLITVNKVGLERNGYTSDDIEQITSIIMQDPEKALCDRPLTQRVNATFRHFSTNMSEMRDARIVPDVKLPELCNWVPPTHILL